MTRAEALAFLEASKARTAARKEEHERRMAEIRSQRERNAAEKTRLDKLLADSRAECERRRAESYARRTLPPRTPTAPTYGEDAETKARRDKLLADSRAERAAAERLLAESEARELVNKAEHERKMAEIQARRPSPTPPPTPGPRTTLWSQRGCPWRAARSALKILVGRPPDAVAL